MKTHSKKNIKKAPLITAMVIVALLTVVAGYLIYTRINQSNNDTTQTDTSTAEQQETQAEMDAATKQQFIDEQIKNSNESDNDEDSTSTTASGQIVMSAKKTSETAVTVFTQLSNIPNGTCTLKVINGSATITQTAEVFYQDEYSTCAGFSIPISELGTGNWTVEITIISGEKNYNKSVSVSV